jgi:hypothetical protein
LKGVSGAPRPGPCEGLPTLPCFRIGSSHHVRDL